MPPEQTTVFWCGSCNRLVAPDAVAVDRKGRARCPICRHELRSSTQEEREASIAVDERPKAPWHFKLLLVATVIYLIYRTIWIVQRLGHHG